MSRASAIDNGNHVGIGLRLSRIVNGVPTIITDKQLNLRMDMLEKKTKRGETEGLRELKAHYKQRLAEVKAKNPRNTTVIKHYQALIKSTERVIDHNEGAV
jgi:hypothetical protein